MPTPGCSAEGQLCPIWASIGAEYEQMRHIAQNARMSRSLGGNDEAIATCLTEGYSDRIQDCLGSEQIRLDGDLRPPQPRTPPRAA